MPVIADAVSEDTQLLDLTGSWLDMASMVVFATTIIRPVITAKGIV
ncbi:MAG: hypothetical protein OEX07_12960 [Gammaproteobacteria bacterium]|nr:hypothetical protein [Gammaproteobacteria bacterium]